MGPFFLREWPPKLVGDIINSIAYTPDIKSDIQISADMCPALSSLDESPIVIPPDNS